MTPEEQACYDNLRADYDALAARLADWHRVADERSAEIVRLSTRLAEAEALLREVRTPPCVDDPTVWVGVSGDWFRRRDAYFAAGSSGTKRAYHETHEPPHCPTCDCAPDSAPAVYLDASTGERHAPSCNYIVGRGCDCGAADQPTEGVK